MKTRLTFFAALAVLLAIAVTPVNAIDGFSFVTVCDPRPSIFTGDTGRDALTEDLNQINDNLPAGWPPPEFVFYVGDIDDPSVTEQAYLNSEVSGLCHVFIPGNHEVDQDCIGELQTHYTPMVASLPTGASVTMNSPTPTDKTMFMIEYENAAFITLDIYYDDDLEDWDPKGVLYDRVMDDFVTNALDQTNKPVKFVFYHEPVFPDVRHVGNSLDDDARCDEFWDLLTIRGVTGTYVGHTHWSDMEDIGQAAKGMQGIFEIDAGCGGLMVGGNNEPVPTLIYTLVTSGGLCLHRRAQPASGRNWSGTVNYTDLSATDREHIVLIDTFEHSGTDLKYWVDDNGNNPDWSSNNEGRWWENAFDASEDTGAGWETGILAVGYDTDGDWPWMNTSIIEKAGGVYAVFTRIPFEIPSQEFLDNFPWLQLGFDYDDAIRVWLNGIEIYASENAPATNEFDQLATVSHQAAGQGLAEPVYTTVNISDFYDLLTTGSNLLVVANWNHSLTSTDLAAGVQLTLKPTSSCILSDCSDNADWVAWGKPSCWCNPRQCRGDIDGIKNGPFWVGIPDLNLLRAAFNKIDLDLPEGGICADLDHIRNGPFRVGIPDLNILRLYFNMFEDDVPICEICD